jgi:hypothetical protein
MIFRDVEMLAHRFTNRIQIGGFFTFEDKDKWLMVAWFLVAVSAHLGFDHLEF